MTPKEQRAAANAPARERKLKAQLAKVTAQWDALSTAAGEALRVEMPNYTDSRAVPDHLVGLAAALCDAADQDKEST